jgi:uncharacterized protein (DUF362 family)
MPALWVNKDNHVVVLKEDVFTYLTSSPYNPPELYPELKVLTYATGIDPTNDVYAMVRQMFSMYGLDKVNYGQKNWNPLSGIISKGKTVVIKPNLVKHAHPLGEDAVLSTVTHASVLRPVIDYVLLALKGEGKIFICDAPLQSADFNKVCEITGLKELIAFYNSNIKNVPIHLLDLRKQVMISSTGHHGDNVVNLPGDPLDYTMIDLKKDSFHSEIDEHWRKFAVTSYDLKNLRRYHNDKRHCYLISNTILAADVIISVPKLKTHKKAGISVALKNFIGITGSKDFLPHHRTGLPHSGGDEYDTNTYTSTVAKDKLMKLIAKIPFARSFYSPLLSKNLLNSVTAKTGVTEGSWYGNDTLWRTILDLNVLMRFSKKDGTLSTSPQKNFLFLVDGIIGQEREGPMDGPPKMCGTLLLGMNPCAVDYVAAKIMGFNIKRVKQVFIPFERRNKMTYPLVEFDMLDVIVVSNVAEYVKIHALLRENSLKFDAPRNWKVLEVD